MPFDALVLVGIPPLALVVFLAIDLGAINISEPWQKLTLALSSLATIVAMLIAVWFAGAGFAGDATFLILLIMIIPGIALRAYTWPQQIYTYCLLAATVHLSLMVAYIANAIAGGISSVAFVAICTLASLVAGCVLHFGFAKRYRRTMDEVRKGWGPAFICTSIGMVLMFSYSFLISGIDVTSVTIDTVFTIFMLLICIAVALTIEGLSSVIVSEHNLKLFKAQALKQQQVDQLHESMREEERRRRHDLRHALQGIIDELKNGKVDDAIFHLEEMRGDTSTTVAAYCKNTVANAALSLWAEKAEDAGIDVVIRADVPEKLSIGPVELASIFGNLMENAYEGCMRVERTEAHRFINVNCHFVKSKLNLQIRNSCRRDIVFVDGIPQTQKQGGGIGTRSVKDTVEHLGGICTYSAKDGVFETGCLKI